MKRRRSNEAKAGWCDGGENLRREEDAARRSIAQLTMGERRGYERMSFFKDRRRDRRLRDDNDEILLGRRKISSPEAIEG